MKSITDNIAGNKVHALFHESRRMYESFVDEQAQKVMSQNVQNIYKLENDIRYGYSSGYWYGDPPATSPEDIINHAKFLNMERFGEIKREVSKALRKAEDLSQMQDIQSKKLQYNDLGLGIFTFARAAMSLRKVYKNGAPVLKPDGKPKIVSDVRKVYAYRPITSKDKDAIKMYVLAGGNSGISGDQMIHTGMGSILIADYLVENGYDVEINTVIGASYQGRQYMQVMKMKSFDSEININDLLLMTADPRWFRYKGFKGIITAFDHAQNSCPSNLGYNLDYRTVKSFLEKINKDEAIPVILDRAYSKEAVIAEVNRVLKTVKQAQSNDY